MTDEKAKLINEIVFLSNIQEELWRYHSANPKKVNVEAEYEDVKSQIQALEEEIKHLD